MRSSSPARAGAAAVVALVALGGCRAEPKKAAEAPLPAARAPHAETAPPRMVEGSRAFALVESLVAFGPRAPGTDGHEKARAFLVRRLRAAGLEVTEQGFDVRSRDGARHRATNLIARVRPDLADRILVGTHWDTRPRADRDPDPSRRNEPIIGANDGGSGTAVLLFLAEDFATAPPPVGIDLVFFDAEDWGEAGDLSEYCIGSRHFASSLEKADLPRGGLVIDMVGDTDPEFCKERHSVDSAPAIVGSLWGIGAAIGGGIFCHDVRFDLYDDHVPLLQAGIPTALMIDLDYAAWHTHADRIDQVRATSLGLVGSVVLTWIHRGAP